MRLQPGEGGVAIHIQHSLRSILWDFGSGSTVPEPGVPKLFTPKTFLWSKLDAQGAVDKLCHAHT